MAVRFIDLFAGLGGFHLALKRVGAECVFACEIDPGLRSLYEKNFGLQPAGDIRDIAISDIPSHDLLCAGFPCQPFSKAGSQQGFGDPRWGDLFSYVLRVVQLHRPRYVILENVPNFERHESGDTWRKAANELTNLGYDISRQRLSPHQFGIPQIRDRLFIVGSLAGLGFDSFAWPDKHVQHAEPSLIGLLDENPTDARGLSANVERCLELWQDFLDRFPCDAKLPSFPIWTMEFGATYPYETETPFAVGVDALRECHGSHGRPLAHLTTAEAWLALPSHARTSQARFPHWKVQFIKQNRDFYGEHKHWIDDWLKTGILDFPSSYQKFEWNCQGAERNVWNLIIQFRASGVRVKRPTTAPSLIAMTDTQVPIIGWERRYLTPRECARLQSMDELYLPPSQSKAFAALGNAVNVDLVYMIANALLATGEQSPLVAEAAG